MWSITPAGEVLSGWPGNEQTCLTWVPGTGCELLHCVIDVILCFISQNKADTLLLHRCAPEQKLDHCQTRLREREAGPDLLPLGVSTLKGASLKRPLMKCQNSDWVWRGLNQYHSVVCRRLRLLRLLKRWERVTWPPGAEFDHFPER